MNQRFDLRPYQERDIARIRAELVAGRNACYQAPCGSGKTVIFGHVAGKVQAAAAAGRSARVLILVHRRELLRQTSDRLTAMGVPHGIIAAGVAPWPEAPIQLASVQTVTRRLEQVGRVMLVIVDEAHHVIADSYTRIIEAQPGARVLGLTATPARLDGRGLGRAAGGPFDALVVGPTIKELVTDGWLAPIEVYAPPSKIDLARVRVRMGDYDQHQLEDAVDRPMITGDAIEHYKRVCPGERAMVFCISVKHAHNVARNFVDAGIPAEAIDGSMGDFERAGILERFGTGETRALMSCDLVGEGLDVPEVGAVISLRPTQSLNLYMQQTGRGARPAPGKTRAVLLDHVGNIYRHGMPDADRAWSLDARPTAGRKPERPLVNLRKCERCFFVYDASEDACPRCGHVNEAKAREVVVAPGQLEKVNDYPDSPMGRQMAILDELHRTWQDRERVRLTKLAREKNYSPAWVERVIGAKEAKQRQMIREARARKALWRANRGE